MSDDAALVRKVGVKLIPFLFLLYVIAYLDRVNVGFAKLHMNDLSWFSERVFGWGAGIFFLGYFLFEVPSNLILRRIGARVWIARIMFTWGAISMAMALARDAASFYGLRFLLGVAEAGFFPGVLLYLTFWFTAKERARVVALFMTANAIALTLGNPASGAILGAMNHAPWGIAGWQWLFLLEGLPAILLGFAVLTYLPNGPDDARWLAPEERQRIAQRLAEGAGAPRETPIAEDGHGIGDLVRDRRVWILCGVYFLLVFGMYGITMWLPQLLKTMTGGNDVQVGFLTAIPYLAAGIVMVGNGVHSDRQGERRFHIVVPATCGAIGLAVSGLPGIPHATSLLCLAVAASGMWATLGPFWAIAPQFLRGARVAAGLALINSVGNLAGFGGPFLVGWVKEQTHTFTVPLFLLATAVLCGGLLALAAPKPEDAR